MNILIAPDSFKETMSAKEVSSIIRKSFQRVFETANIIEVPLADGGEGTVEALIDSTNGKLIKCEVLNPLLKPIEASYGVLGDNQTAVIEMASSSGLELLKENEKNPLNTSTYGFGQLINHALDNGIKKLILGLGGSATNDAGIGMLQALGVEFYDKDENLMKILCAKDIKDIKSFHIKALEQKFKDVDIKVACDVINPLCGINGASYVFSPQKGADKKMVELLDSCLLNFANLCESYFNKDTKDIEGCGAAGGLGFALITFLDGKLLRGIDIVIDSVNLEEKIKTADLVITGEGKIDSQTIQGKTPIGVARLAKKHNKKVIAICGCTSNDYEIVYKHGIDLVFDITPNSMSFEDIKKNSKKNLKQTAYNVALCLSMNIN